MLESYIFNKRSTAFELKIYCVNEEGIPLANERSPESQSGKFNSNQNEDDVFKKFDVNVLELDNAE